MNPLENKQGVLFFTRKMSLAKWCRRGFLERELALYRGLEKCGIDYTFVTYGGSDECSYVSGMKHLRVISNRFSLPESWYGRSLAAFHYQRLKTADFFKTNQISGGRLAVQISRLFKKPLIARCGMVPSRYHREKGWSEKEREQQEAEERFLFSYACGVMVPTEADKDYVTQKYTLSPEKIEVAANYVDTLLFRPAEGIAQQQEICTIAKAGKQKNLGSLLEALHGLDAVSCVIIGSAGRDEALKEKARTLHLKIKFLGDIPNAQVAEELKNSKAFILPSLYEGHPKALLEAMACGLPVIGTDVPGVREIIRHRENGFLCGTDAASIRKALEEVIWDPVLQRQMGAKARQDAVEKFSLDQAIQNEIRIYRRIADSSSMAHANKPSEVELCQK